MSPLPRGVLSLLPDRAVTPPVCAGQTHRRIPGRVADAEVTVARLHASPLN